jgi:hypothetical protein
MSHSYYAHLVSVYAVNQPVWIAPQAAAPMPFITQWARFGERRKKTNGRLKSSFETGGRAYASL